MYFIKIFIDNNCKRLQYRYNIKRITQQRNANNFRNYLGVPKLALAMRRSRVREHVSSLIRAAKASFGTPES